MNFPVWVVEVGGGRLVALTATLHVFVAQVAVGAAVLLPWLEARARRREDAALLGWVRSSSGALSFGVRVASALSGACLWLVVAVVSPAAAEALARALFWPFAVAWLAGAVSLASGLAYATGWERLSRRDHLVAGWLGAAAALTALLLAEGVASFMLEPDATFDDAGLLGVLTTPHLAPALVLRLSASAGLAGLAVLATAWRQPPALRARLARLGALVALPGAMAGPLGAWLASWVAGPAHLEVIQGEVQSATLGFAVAVVASALVVVGLGLVAWLAPRRPGLVSWPVAAALALVALAAQSGAEHVRAAVRKPWVIGSGARGAMYASGLTPAQAQRARQDGLLAWARFSAARRDGPAGAPAEGGPGPGAALGAAARGQEVFTLACRACHTVNGPRGMARIVQGLPRPAIAVAVARLEKLRGRMPPFPGSPADADDLVTWLGGLDGVLESPPAPPPSGDRIEAGRRVLAYRCLMCHRDLPLRPRVKGWTEPFAYQALGRLQKLNGGMPPFGGDDEERRALAAYLSALGAGQAE